MFNLDSLLGSLNCLLVLKSLKMMRLAGVGGQTPDLFYFLAGEKWSEGGTFSSEQGGKRPKDAERGEEKTRSIHAGIRC